MPVHNWLVRHVYFPALRGGLPKPAAMVMTFFVSGVAHEYVALKGSLPFLFSLTTSYSVMLH